MSVCRESVMYKTAGLLTTFALGAGQFTATAAAAPQARNPYAGIHL